MKHTFWDKRNWLIAYLQSEFQASRKSIAYLEIDGERTVSLNQYVHNIFRLIKKLGKIKLYASDGSIKKLNEGKQDLGKRIPMIIITIASRFQIPTCLTVPAT